MNIEESNKIIAEYMGCPFNGNICTACGATHERCIYSNSLDALVPVWEKLVFQPNFWMEYDKNNWVCIEREDLRVAENFYNSYSGKCSSIQEAACIATAKAILELKDK